MSGGCPGSSATKWASQIFSYIVRAGIIFSGVLSCQRPERQIIREPAASIKLAVIQPEIRLGRRLRAGSNIAGSRKADL